jgi:hypothetical protein
MDTVFKTENARNRLGQVEYTRLLDFAKDLYGKKLYENFNDVYRIFMIIERR